MTFSEEWIIQDVKTELFNKPLYIIYTMSRSKENQRLMEFQLDREVKQWSRMQYLKDKFYIVQEQF